MIEFKHYELVLSALKMACETLEDCDIPPNDTNRELSIHKTHGSLIGYYLMKATKMAKEGEIA